MIMFNNEIDLDFDFDEIACKKWINNIVKKFSYKINFIEYIFCTNEYIKQINNKYLNHNYYTDIITFDYTENNLICAEMYISIEQIKLNSLEYNENFYNEFYRVIIHGVLHCLGFDDKNQLEYDLMKQKENEYLLLLYDKYL